MCVETQQMPGNLPRSGGRALRQDKQQGQGALRWAVERLVGRERRPTGTALLRFSIDAG